VDTVIFWVINFVLYLLQKITQSLWLRDVNLKFF